MPAHSIFRVALFVTLTALALPATAKESASEFKVNVVPFGPTQEDVDALDAALPDQPAVQALLKGSNFRRLHTEMIEPDVKKSGVSLPPSRFRAVFYDYTKQRAVVVEGAVANRASITARVVPDWQPDPSDEEFAQAVAVISSDATIGPDIASGNLTVYRPMPPVQDRDANGKPATQRVINVGLSPAAGVDKARHEIVGADLVAQTVTHYANHAPLGAAVNAQPNCGSPNASQSTTARGTAGQFQLTVTSGSTTLWEMLVIRPSASSGTRASGIEVRDVKYKGISVLKRGHVPILNVKYTNDLCGPYRDWQWQEGQFATTPGATLLAPGILDNGTTPATTALETGTDTGNFKGVAIYREGSEVVLVTELEAGWYRYIHEWRFDSNGAIRPRFGFGTTVNSCTCVQHAHHVYFRLDIDIDGPVNQVYEIPVGATNTDDLPAYRVATEKKITRVLGTSNYYRFRGGKKSYTLVAGANDGMADTYARGDLWLLQYKSGVSNLLAEIDDGHNNTVGSGTEADLDQFVNGESLNGQDIVAWYHATVTHSPALTSFMCTPTGLGIAGRNILTGDKVVGPDLLPEDLN